MMPPIRMRLRFDLRLQRILAAAERAEKRMLMHVGGYIRKTAKNMMKKGKGKSSSLPGMPPYFWTEIYRQNIRYAYDKARRSVVIGGVSLGGRTTPGTIEYGGIEILTNKRRGTRKIGKYAPRPAMRLALQMAINQAIGAALRNYIT